MSGYASLTRPTELFIDARHLGHLVERTRHALSDEDIEKIASTYHAWRGEPDRVGRVSPTGRNPTAGTEEVGLRCANPTYRDVPGFCKAATIEEIAGHGYVLTPRRYVGAAAVDEDETPFVQRFATFHAWRGEPDRVGRVSPTGRNPTAGAEEVGLRYANPTYRDVPGFCQSATKEEIAGHGYGLSPGRYVGGAAVEEDETPFVERFAALQEWLEGQFEEAERLTGVIRVQLARASADGC
jgi:type I restriction-modification system DNA methylase subunit